MNGVHDMGGMHGLGPVEREEREPVFHEQWERRVLGMSVAAAFSAAGTSTCRASRAS
jgi:nitrile hydratase subunit beta